MLRARKLVEIGASMAEGNFLYAVGKYVLFSVSSPGLIDATYYEAVTLFIVWAALRKEHA